MTKNISNRQWRKDKLMRDAMATVQGALDARPWTWI